MVMSKAQWDIEQAKILQRSIFRNRILPNKKKDVKPEITDE